MEQSRGWLRWVGELAVAGALAAVLVAVMSAASQGDAAPTSGPAAAPEVSVPVAERATVDGASVVVGSDLTPATRT